MKHSKNILMVYPKFPSSTYWSFSYALPFIGKKSAMPPLGLITVAAMLPEHYKLKLIDMNIETLRDADILWADAVFTSSMVVQKKSLEEVVLRANRLGVPVVAGGPYPTQFYNKIRGVSHFVLGEAESGVLESFIEDFERGQAKKAYARIVLRKKESERIVDEREFNVLKSFFGSDSDIKIAGCRPDMSRSPIPRFDLLDMDAYASMSVQNSRGCPHSCEFCNESFLFGHEPRLKSADRIVNELDLIYSLGYRGAVFVVDDNFIGDKVKIKRDLVYIRKFQEDRKFPFSLYTEATITLAEDKELMRLMRDAGFNMVFVGIETIDKDVLKSMSKHHNLRNDLLESVRTIQRYGMSVTGGFIVGNDNEPDDICDRIFDFCQTAGIPAAMVGLLTAFNGSPLGERLKAEGRLLHDSEGDNTHYFDLNFVPLGNKERIVRGYKRLISRLYDRSGKNYYKRCSVLLENLGYNPKGVRSIGASELRAFFMSLRKQSFSLNYLKFLGNSLIMHPGMLPEAFSMAVTGYHYRKITSYALRADELNNRIMAVHNYLSGHLKAGMEGGEKMLNQFRADASEFLDNVNKRIQKFPPDYRPKLLDTYGKIASRLKKS